MGYEVCQKIIDLIESLGYGVFFVDSNPSATTALSHKGHNIILLILYLLTWQSNRTSDIHHPVFLAKAGTQ